jgi:uncharacterized membrane protein YadS
VALTILSKDEVSRLIACVGHIKDDRVKKQSIATGSRPITPIKVILAAVISTIVFDVLMATWLKLPCWRGLLSGGATATCGASAALAIVTALPRGPEKERFTLVVVMAVTALSTLVMVAYASWY